MKRKFTLIACLLALALTGCGAQIEYPEHSKPEDTTESTTDTRDEPREDIVLTFACGGDMEIDDVVRTFNAADNGYRIEVVERGGSSWGEDGRPVHLTEDEQKKQDFALLQKVINTDEIDIFCTQSFCDPSYYELLKAKGAFADLYPFMAEDDAVNPDTLFAPVLRASEVNGHLYDLPTFFCATTLWGLADYVGTEENWSVDDFIEHWREMPEGARIQGSLQADTICGILLRRNIASFVDYANAEVHFDSPDFRRLLAFCGEFEGSHGQKGELDYEAPQFVTTCLLQNTLSAVFFHDTTRTMVGFPTADGSGAYFSNMGLRFAVSARSSPEKQQAAWEFVRTFADYEYQKNHVIMTEGDHSQEWGLSINRQVFDETMEEVSKGYYYGTTTERPSAEDCAAFKRYLEGIDRYETSVSEAVREIVREETTAYFEGQIDLDTAIDRIQSRASIWISEQS